MNLAQQRREAALKRANFYRALATGTAFVFLGNLATYSDLFKGCILVLVLAVIATNFQPMGAIINQFASAHTLRRAKVNQMAGVLFANASIPLVLFLVGVLI